MSNVKFFWNGIKIDGTLYKGYWSEGPYTKTSGLPRGTISMYARDYTRIPQIPGLTVSNESDSMTDYFETDTVRITPDSPHYEAAAKAVAAAKIHSAKLRVRQCERMLERKRGTHTETMYQQELSDSIAYLEKLTGKKRERKPAKGGNTMRIFTQKEWDRQQYKGQWGDNPYNRDRVAAGELPEYYIGRRNVMVGGDHGPTLLTEGVHFLVEDDYEHLPVVCKANALKGAAYQFAGGYMVIDNIYQISEEYAKEHDLLYRDRIEFTQHAPWGTVPGGCALTH